MAELAVAPELEVITLSKRFGNLAALDAVSFKVAPGEFHALLGENGAGKSTLVKCIMGFYRADSGQILLDSREVSIRTPKDAQDLRLGMVYQHFTLVDNMSVAENLLLARSRLPAIIDWPEEMRTLQAFVARMPFAIKLDALVRDLAAGEKQKVEIAKQLYLDSRVLILDEPTSVLTPQEADYTLGLIREMTRARLLSVIMITHKFREVERFADTVTVLRRGKLAGGGAVPQLDRSSLAQMMIGSETLAQPAQRSSRQKGEVLLQVDHLETMDGTGARTIQDLSFEVRAGEILGVAGVSGNGQRQLVEILAGQRTAKRGSLRAAGEAYAGRRDQMAGAKLHCLPEEPMKNACVPAMSVLQNLLLRRFDRAPYSRRRFLLNARAMRRYAASLVHRFRIKTVSIDAPLSALSGGNVQRTVLARELGDDLQILVVANPCFGLDFSATAEIRAAIMAVRNRGAAILLLSEDLDEILELSDRVVVMSNGAFNYASTREAVDLTALGAAMAGG
jgi:general nucleoside transport system ATP-binding protein